MSLRDEDISFPPSLNKLHQGSLKEILSALSQLIDQNAPNALSAHLRMMRAILLLSLNAFEGKDKLAKEVKGEEEEKASSKNKKKGKGKKKEDI